MANKINAKIYKRRIPALKYAKCNDGNIFKKYKKVIKMSHGKSIETFIPYYIVTVGDYK